MPTRWPTQNHAVDPWDDGCWPSLDTKKRFDAVWKAWHAHQRGDADPEAFEHVASAAGLTDPLLEDRNRPSWGHPCPSLAELARIATDPWPAAGGDVPDIALGPASTFAEPALRLAALASGAFLLTEDRGQSSFSIWRRGKPMPSEALRAKIRAVGLAPWALWERLDDGHLADRTGLGSYYHPTGPVTVLGTLPVNRFFGARVLRVDTGWVAHCVIPLERMPPPGRIRCWIREETWLARTFQPGITTESLLRKRPLLIRKSLEYIQA